MRFPTNAIGEQDRYGRLHLQCYKSLRNCEFGLLDGRLECVVPGEHVLHARIHFIQQHQMDRESQVVVSEQQQQQQQPKLQHHLR